MIKEKLMIKGMHCGSCAMTIDEELEELEGVAEAKTSFRKQTTEIVFDEHRIDLNAIQNAIRDLGYEPTVA